MLSVHFIRWLIRACDRESAKRKAKMIIWRLKNSGSSVSRVVGNIKQKFNYQSMIPLRRWQFTECLALAELNRIENPEKFFHVASIEMRTHNAHSDDFRLEFLINEFECWTKRVEWISESIDLLRFSLFNFFFNFGFCFRFIFFTDVASCVLDNDLSWKCEWIKSNAVHRRWKVDFQPN